MRESVSAISGDHASDRSASHISGPAVEIAANRDDQRNGRSSGSPTTVAVFRMAIWIYS